MISLTNQALVFIGSAVLLVPLFKKLGFGSVLGYIIAGVLVGPFGLKLIEDSESVLSFSELGVVFLLFIIGLEIHPRKLWSMRRHLLGLGGLQILFCSIVFSIFAALCGLSTVTAIVVGFAFSLSSTAFSTQMLIEKNMMNTEFGRSSFAILLMQDLIAIPALAVIPALGLQQMTTQKPNVLLGFLIIIALVVISRLAIRPLFRFIANLKSREVFLAATLFIVLGVEALMQAVGMSAALGTFIAGVLLADSEYRHELETNIEPFKGLLMGLFFIAVGMQVNLSIIFNKPFVVFALTLAYLMTKSLIIYFIGKFFKLNHNNAKLTALTISQGGEFAFVIFAIMNQISLADKNMISFLTVIITLSMALNPILSLISAKISKYKDNSSQNLTFDKIDDQAAQVIIAGFGRFGQTFGRILRAQGIAFVAIDQDPDQIELVRKFGNKVYYGDVSRLDILESAGAQTAKYLVLAIDNIEQSIETAKLVKQNFPNLKIFARARNRGHVFDLMSLQVTAIKREMFDSSVNFVKDLLIDIGVPEHKAQIIVEKFKMHDDIMIQEQYKVRQDDKMFISLSHQGAAQLAQVLSQDEMQSHISTAPKISSPKNN